MSIAFATHSARAETGDEALVEEGLKLRRNRQDAEALTFFRRAYDVRPAPRTQAQIALAEQALGKWVDAERDLKRSLAATDDTWIASHSETLLKALDAIAKHLGTLDIEANAAPAKLWVDGTEVGDLPIDALRVVAGSVRLEVRAAGYETATRSVEVTPGTRVKEKFDLAQVPSTPAPLVQPPAAVPAPAAEPSAATRPVPVSTGGAPSVRRTVAWTTLGAAGAFLGGAIVAQIVRETNAAHYNDDSRCLYGGLSREQRCGVYRGQAQSAQALANIGYVAAGALGAASAILFWMSVPVPKASGVQVGLQMGSSGTELRVEGKF